MIVKCYTLFPDSFGLIEDLTDEQVLKISIKNKVVLAYFDKNGIYFPMEKTKFNPRIFDELFRIIPDVTFEILSFKKKKLYLQLISAKTAFVNFLQRKKAEQFCFRNLKIIYQKIQFQYHQN